MNEPINMRNARNAVQLTDTAILVRFLVCSSEYLDEVYLGYSKQCYCWW